MSALRWARIAYSLVAWLFAIGTIVQVYLAGTSIANLGGSGNFELHRNIGYAIGLLTLLLVVLSLAGRMPLRVIGASALLLVLMAGQSVLVAMKTSTPQVAALHPVNGFLLVLVAFWVAWRTLGFIRAPLPATPPRQMAQPTTPDSPSP